ncbi:hypothetical protein Pcinc_040542 [Petrolisthes cinctipes]|uniref:Uncharacterized protein n=1 Tax=Petrolisthes cinctipes TaxID=88211 RepID=A0AAE1EHX0_PETCI|nr:hypothetical protein Pcinc_040542 [Petrolisthes cinctipes]
MVRVKLLLIMVATVLLLGLLGTSAEALSLDGLNVNNDIMMATSAADLTLSRMERQVGSSSGSEETSASDQDGSSVSAEDSDERRGPGRGSGGRRGGGGRGNGSGGGRGGGGGRGNGSGGRRG